MIQFEKIINVEEYNYLKGRLKLKFSGNEKSAENFNKTYSIDAILDAEFIAQEKFLSPHVPKGISKDKVSILAISPPLKTIITKGDQAQIFSVQFDKLIISNECIDNNNNITAPIYNTVLDNKVLFSTVDLNAFLLIKQQKTEVETGIAYEVFTQIEEGLGEIILQPKKEYYEIGQKVKFHVQPAKNYRLKKIWLNELELNSNNNNFSFIVKEDTTVKAEFEKISEPIYVNSKDSKIFHSESFNRSNGYTNIPQGGRRINKETWGGFKNNSTVKSIKKSGDGLFSSIFKIIGWFFTLFYYGIVLFFTIWFLIVLFKAFGWIPIIGIGVILLFSWLWKYLSPILRGLGNFILGAFSLFLLILMGIGVYNFLSNSYKTTFKKSAQPPKTVEVKKENNTIDYNHTIQWKDYEQRPHKVLLSINSDFVNLFSQKRKEIKVNSQKEYSFLLKNLYDPSDESLFKTYQALKPLKDSVSQQKFPELVTSMVQHIPYYVIVDGSCNPMEYEDSKIRELLLTNPCEPYIKNGIKSPPEFLKDLKGDCDTRSLFAYSILKHFGYDVVILSSLNYKHSMLGINETQVDAKGLTKIHNQKKYLFCELTARSKIGQINPEISNPTFWTVDLK